MDGRTSMKYVFKGMLLEQKIKEWIETSPDTDIKKTFDTPIYYRGLDDNTFGFGEEYIHDRDNNKVTVVKYVNKMTVDELRKEFGVEKWESRVQPTNKWEFTNLVRWCYLVHDKKGHLLWEDKNNKYFQQLHRTHEYEYYHSAIGGNSIIDNMYKVLFHQRIRLIALMNTNDMMNVGDEVKVLLELYEEKMTKYLEMLIGCLPKINQKNSHF